MPDPASAARAARSQSAERRPRERGGDGIPVTITAPYQDQGGLRSDWHAPFEVDAALILSAHRRGAQDPTFRTDASGAIWRTSLTPDGPATVRLAVAAADPAAPRPGSVVRAAAWGAGSAWLLAQVPALLGAQDDPGSFRPIDPAVRDLLRRHAGFRVGRTGRVLEALVPAVLEQKVLGKEARRAWRDLLHWHGLPAPGRRRPACGCSRRRPRGGRFRPSTGTGPVSRRYAPGPSRAPRSWPAARGRCRDPWR